MVLPVGRIPWARKIVDDTIIWKTTKQELLDCARIVLQQCKENITISQKKLIRRTRHLGRGLWARQRQVHSNSKLPTPQESTRPQGLYQPSQPTGMFIPDLAHMTSPLHPRMKWLQEHKDAFLKTKQLLTSTSLVES